MLEGVERLLDSGGRFPKGGALHRLRPGLTEIGDGLLPHLTPERVVGQALNVLPEPLGVASLDGLDRPAVERAPAVLEKAAVGHLVGERVLEGVLDVGEQARLALPYETEPASRISQPWVRWEWVISQTSRDFPTPGSPTSATT
jgi:hypothetical protein